MVAGVAAMIRIDALWLETTFIDMRMGAERLLARGVQLFGSTQVHHGYLFAKACGSIGHPQRNGVDVLSGTETCLECRKQGVTNVSH